MDINKLAKVMKALSNPNRLELYLEIVKKNEASFRTGGETFVNEIIDCLNIGAPTISHHLKELSNADLITTERRGKYLIAKVNNEIIEEVGSILRLNNSKS
ncbi:ArsR/SmtB family transcription factor [Desulfosporosinus nitroreducens]|uniref:Metalloregulator ArsR/SmtB family transcription factor n=1 Tax=Desulfosporosinus nitroreducens TaxID=2018668 RepID=A0ABT8QM97_9FIRM|nr:metalloregulator ArsR/SmtB family transcription factor [Desulfosporosinus nitroreducens]MDO0822472.1 metalloregulator ArsR/SmtB family transcription factor [Desulfosporosinus nitroreducens]